MSTTTEYMDYSSDDETVLLIIVDCLYGPQDWPLLDEPPPPRLPLRILYTTGLADEAEWYLWYLREVWGYSNVPPYRPEVPRRRFS